jgi:hypothetical protein
MTRKPQLACTWTGPALVVRFVIGCGALAGFIPPPYPADSAIKIAGICCDHTTSSGSAVL